MLYASATFVVTAGWWPVAVWLTPAGDRPYIGSTGDNSVFSLLVGYNGFDRLTGSNGRPLAPGTSTPDFVNRALHLFGTEMGSQVAWLLPAAVLLAFGALVASRGSACQARKRAALVLWGGWLLVAGSVFTFGQGTINPYYTVLLVPAMSALIGTGSELLWARRAEPAARWALAGCSAFTAVWAFDLLDRSGPWHPWVRDMVLLAGLLSFLGIARWGALNTLPRLAVVVATLLACLSGPLAYDIGTASNPTPSTDPYASLVGMGQAAGGAQGVLGCTSAPVASEVSRGSGGSRWAAAVVGAAPAAGYQLATGRPVMAIGGWSGTDPVPDLSVFQGYVARGEVRLFISAGPCGGLVFGRLYEGSDASAVTRWVSRSFRARPFHGLVVYDLSAPLRTGHSCTAQARCLPKDGKTPQAGSLGAE
jgi:4-amino-4-deoxy-L-arabinose transferase-like glycosyltransferase